MHNLQWRLLIPLSIFLALSLTGLGLFLGFSYHDDQLSTLKQRLGEEARTVSNAVLPFLTSNDGVDSTVKELGRGIDIRITIIGTDGTVLGDSLEDPAAMENHAGRPEVREALSTGYGESSRFSTTLGYEMQYVAVAIVSPGNQVIGVSRVSLPLAEVQITTGHVVQIVVIAVAVSIIVIIAGLWIISRMVTMPVRQLTNDVRRITSGGAGVTTAVTSQGEIGELGKALNTMSLRMAELLSDFSSEKQRFESILANMADGVILSDAAGRLVLSNEAAARIFGFDAGTAKGKSIIEAVRDHEVDELLKQVLSVTREASARFESMVHHRFLRAIAVQIDHGGNKGALLLFQDFTELRELQTMRRELIGNISHEFRTPLSGIRAIVETLEDGALSEPEVALDFLSKIRAEVDRLTQMVSELTDLSMIEAAGTDLEREQLKISPLVNEVITQLNPLAARSSVSIDSSSDDKVADVNADPRKIRRVITNLLHNAIKFTPPGGHITINVRQAKSEVIVTVADTGIGIKPADLPHVFERFFKADRARTASGTGLGLAIVKHIVQAHGGKVWAESEPGKGSTFGFSLPVEPQLLT